jgi:hypothetical protein
MLTFIATLYRIGRFTRGGDIERFGRAGFQAPRGRETEA